MLVMVPLETPFELIMIEFPRVIDPFEPAYTKQKFFVACFASTIFDAKFARGHCHWQWQA